MSFLVISSLRLLLLVIRIVGFGSGYESQLDHYNLRALLHFFSNLKNISVPYDFLI